MDRGRPHIDRAIDMGPIRDQSNDIAGWINERSIYKRSIFRSLLRLYRIGFGLSQSRIDQEQDQKRNMKGNQEKIFKTNEWSQNDAL